MDEIQGEIQGDRDKASKDGKSARPTGDMEIVQLQLAALQSKRSMENVFTFIPAIA